MMPIEAAIVPFELNTLIGTSQLVQVYNDESSNPIHLFGSDIQLAGSKDDIVITPGGPRRRDQVHRVGPGEAVRQNEDGTYTIVPKEAPDGPAPKDQPKKEK